MDALVVDTHCDTIWVEHLREWGMRPSEMQANFAKLKKGGVDVEFCAISVGTSERWGIIL